MIIKVLSTRFILISTLLSVAALFLAGFLVNTNYESQKQEIKTSSIVEIDNNWSTFASPTPRTETKSLEIPTTHVITGGQHVFQTFNNCGPASLSMTLSYFGESVSQVQLGQRLRPYQNPQGDNDDKSVTLAEIAQIAKQYDLLAYHRPAGNIELLQAFIAQDIPVITRTWLKPGEDIGHYRVVKGYDQQRQVLIQDDSLQGANLEYSYQDFKQIWQAFNYEFLILVPPSKQEMAKQILGELINQDQAWQQARQLAETQLQINSADVYASFNLVVAWYHLGQYEAARKQFEIIEELLPKRMLWYQIEPILVYYQLGQYEKVSDMIEEIFNSQNRAFSELYWLRAQIYKKRQQPVLASQALEKANFYNQGTHWKVNLP